MMRADDQGIGAPAQGAAAILPMLSTKNIVAKVSNLNMRLQHMIDITAPLPIQRWAITGGLLILFMLRIIHIPPSSVL